MENLEEKMLRTINTYQLVKEGDKIVLGISGGPDSMCMLNAFIKLSKRNLKFKDDKEKSQGEKNVLIEKSCQKNPSPLASFEIVVAHVNHRLRKEAKQDDAYVKNYCEKNGIEFYVKSIDVQKMAHTNKIGTEEAGRKARYEFFDEVLKNVKATKIAIAHNKNDKIETILLHTLRGSGIEGLKGIEAKRGNIIRPLIECERSEIESYCEKNNLHPCIDSSNFENIYHRNKVRNVVIPYIQKEFNPNIIKTIDRLSDIVQLEDEYMENQTKKAYHELVLEEKDREIVVDLKKFNLQETVIKSRLMRYIIKRLFGTTASIEKIHIDDMIKLCANNVGNKYLTPNKNFKVLVKNHRIFFSILS